MATRTTGVIRRPPHHFSDILHKLGESGRVFIELYECKKERMQAIAGELGRISKEVEQMQKETNRARMFGVACGGLGIAVGVAALLFAGVSSVSEKATYIAGLGCSSAILGGASVITANAVKAVEEKTSLETVERLGNEFMAITEVLKDALREIKNASEELEERSSSLMTKTGGQAKRGLSKTTQLQQHLEQTAELAEKSKQVLNATLTTQREVRELLNVITRITPNSAEDDELRHCVTGSASQCRNALSEFATMRKMLKDFEDMPIQ